MPATSIYLDHNATTPPAPEVIAAMDAVWRDAYGNPGSRHSSGRLARRALEDARELVASILGAKPSEVVFTSGGTEANNTALFGYTQGAPACIALPEGEHPSIEMAVRRREAQGWQRVLIPLDTHGLIRVDALESLDWSQLRVMTFLLAHNETGVIQPTGELARLCQTHQVPLHLDAVQAVGKFDVNFHELQATSLSLGAHKFHGPRGIGALLIRDRTLLPPLLVGGHQEREHRAGTEPVALAVGLAKALELWHNNRTRDREHLIRLRDRLESQLVATCHPTVVHGAGAERLPNTLNIGFPGCDGEALLVSLDLAGVCCSMGSACASGSSDPAPILLSMGCSRELALASLRFSVGRNNTLSEIDEAAQRIATVVGRMGHRQT